MVSHEHGEVGEVAAGAGSVCAVRTQQPAAQWWPLACHRALRIVPEGAIWSVVILQLSTKQKQMTIDEKCLCQNLSVIRVDSGHLQVFECEDHRLSKKHSAGLFVDRGSNNMGVDRQALLFMSRPFHFHLHCGVLGGQKGPQVFI